MTKNIINKIRVLVLAVALVFGMLGVSVVNTNKVEAKELSGVKSVGINRVDCSTPFSVQVWSNSTTCWINEGAQDVTLYNVSGGSGGHWDTNVGYVTDVPHHFTIPNCMSMQILGTVTAYVVHILRFSTSNC